jgi:hypothetical protein
MSRHSIMRIKPRKRIQGVERWFIDIETWRLNARNFAFCVLKNWKGDVTRVFYDAKKARDFLHSRPLNVIVYAHNCWKFDGLAFYDIEELMPASRLVAGNRIISIRWDYPREKPPLITSKATVVKSPLKMSIIAYATLRFYGKPSFNLTVPSMSGAACLKAPTNCPLRGLLSPTVYGATTIGRKSGHHSSSVVHAGRKHLVKSC